MTTKLLIVVLATRISEWVTKGEVTPGYFNPDKRFDHIVIIGLAPDNPSQADLVKLAGTEKVEYINAKLITPLSLLITCGFHSLLVRRLMKACIPPDIASQRPLAVRAYGDGLAGKCAVILGHILGCRSVASIHTTCTIDPARRNKGLKARLMDLFEGRARIYAQQHLDYLIPVYSPALAAISASYIHKTFVIPNAVATNKSHKKKQFDDRPPVKIITFGRQVPGKNAFPILSALAKERNWHLTIVGDGPEVALVLAFAAKNGLLDQILHIPQMHNEQLLSKLDHYNIYMGWTAYAEIPKTLIEAGLSGLPIVQNPLPIAIPPELTQVPIIWTTSSRSYGDILRDLTNEPERMKILGDQTRSALLEHFDPNKAGVAMADLLETGEQNFYPSARALSEDPKYGP